MGGKNIQYRYNGHLIDVFVNLFGFVAYLDNDLEPLDVSEEEYLDIVSNGKFIGM